MTDWIVVADDQVKLNADNAGEIKFTVTNPGPSPDTVFFDVIPGEGMERGWITFAEQQKLVPPNTSVEFIGQLKVPPGPPGKSSLVGRAYSANLPPEESSRTSGRVTFEWKPKEKPRPKWPWIAAAAALVVLVAGVVTWLAWPAAKSPPPIEATAVTTVTPQTATGYCILQRARTFTFTSVISVTGGPVTVRYKWLRSDNAQSPEQTVEFTGTGAQQTSVTTSWTVGASGTYWQALQILDPDEVRSNQATFTFTCVPLTAVTKSVPVIK